MLPLSLDLFRAGTVFLLLGVLICIGSELINQLGNVSRACGSSAKAQSPMEVTEGHRVPPHEPTQQDTKVISCSA